MTTPPWLPAPGFYRHYKHKPEDGITSAAYEVLGWAKHTETEEYLVIYRPLYKDETPITPGLQFARPLHMFMGETRQRGKSVPRFARITDEDAIARLEWFRDQMYGKAVRK